MIDRVNIAQQLSKSSSKVYSPNVNFTTEQPSHYINPHKLRDGIEGTCKTLLSYKEKGQSKFLDSQEHGMDVQPSLAGVRRDGHAEANLGVAVFAGFAFTCF